MLAECDGIDRAPPCRRDSGPGEGVPPGRQGGVGVRYPDSREQDETMTAVGSASSPMTVTVARVSGLVEHVLYGY
jgi:hypothetical protein